MESRTCGNHTCQRKEQRAGEFLLCSACNAVAYCSKECQKVHWKQAHRKDCKIFAQRRKLEEKSNRPRVIDTKIYDEPAPEWRPVDKTTKLKLDTPDGEVVSIPYYIHITRQFFPQEMYTEMMEGSAEPWLACTECTSCNDPTHIRFAVSRTSRLLLQALIDLGIHNRDGKYIQREKSTDEPNAVGTEEKVDEKGINTKNVALIVSLCAVQRRTAVESLRAHKGHLVDAIMSLPWPAVSCG